MKTIKKLTLNKTIISSLSREQTGQIKGGGDGGNETAYACATIQGPECGTEICGTNGDSLCIACNSDYGMTCNSCEGSCWTECGTECASNCPNPSCNWTDCAY